MSGTEPAGGSGAEDGSPEGSEPAEPGEAAGAATEVSTWSDSLLRVRELDAGYGDLQILTDVTMDVRAGEYVTIVGPNGAGKSTVMKSVFGLTALMGGTVTFDGTDITGWKPEEIIHEGLGYVPQNDNVFPTLTIRENLEMGAYILDEVPQDALEMVFERFPILEERQDQRAENLSGGQQQMLAMGRALMLSPPLLLLDEPSAGLAPDLVDEMFDRGYVLVNGTNRYEDSGEALLADPQVRQDFLGG